MSKKVQPPEWCREAKKIMIDRDESVTQMAEAIEYDRAYVSCVLNGTMDAPRVKAKIMQHLGMMDTATA